MLIESNLFRISFDGVNFGVISTRTRFLIELGRIGIERSNGWPYTLKPDTIKKVGHVWVKREFSYDQMLNMRYDIKWYQKYTGKELTEAKRQELMKYWEEH